MNEPRPSFAVPRSARDVVIFPWIGRRKPTENILLQLITCQKVSVIPGSNDNDGMTDASACSSRSRHDEGFLTLSQTRKSLVIANKTYRGLLGHRQQKPCRLGGRVFKGPLITSGVKLLTVHDRAHIPDETMDNLESLSYGSSSLVLRESV